MNDRMILAALLLLTAAAETPADAAAADHTPEIVVRAVRGKCEIAYAGSRLDGRGLQKLADGWPAGRPVRVVEPRGADRKCLTKVTLILAERGFNNIVFVEAAPVR